MMMVMVLQTVNLLLIIDFHFFQYVAKWLKSLEEFRYRKVPGVDARRIASFVNNGINETDLPNSLVKKWDRAKYGREKHLANKFVRERINTESVNYKDFYKGLHNEKKEKKK